MCGYSQDSYPGVDDSLIEAQFASGMEKYKGEPVVKIFNSGSFLDPAEIGADVRQLIVSKIAECGARRLIVESRPEFVTSEAVADLTGFDGMKVWVAMGLESSSDLVRERCVAKGFSFADFKKAADLLADLGVGCKTYLLLKPPYLTEREGVADALSSIADSAEISGEVSVNPMNVQAWTEVEMLWKRREYRTPWLWSVVEVLKVGSTKTDARLISAPTAGGKPRGAHNCGECDERVLKAISKFSLSGDVSMLDGLDCACKDEWKAAMELGDLAFSTVDAKRFHNW